MRVTAVSPSNIALVKYWGKRDPSLNLPLAGSLSMTLRDMESRTTAEYVDAAGQDTLILGGTAAPEAALAKTKPVLDAVRRLRGGNGHFRVVSENTFPTGAGLASSASGLSALAVAAAGAAGLKLSTEELSVLARLGSGSACRSLVGGFAEWLPGADPSGNDSYAVQVAPAEHWALRMLVVVVEQGPKSVSSTAGMGQTKRSSPFFDAWVATVGTHLEECRRAVLDRDFDTLARVAQASALAMHAAMIASTPSLRYWRPGTLAVLDALDRLAADGVPLAYTIDAGPNVKVVLPPGDDHTAFDALRALPAVQRIIQTGPGPGARLVPDAHGAAS